MTNTFSTDDDKNKHHDDDKKSETEKDFDTGMEVGKKDAEDEKKADEKK